MERKLNVKYCKLNRIFHIIFLLAFGWIVLNIFLNFGDQNIFYIVAGFIFLAGFVIFYQLLNRHMLKKNTCDFDKIFGIMFIIMLLLQLLFGYMLTYEPVTDLGNVHAFAKSVAQTGSFSHIYDLLPSAQGYMARYPNNNGIFLLLTGYYRIIYLAFGRITLFDAVILNVTALSTSVFFTYRTAKKIFSPAGALLTFLLCFFFLPYYTYTPFFYTDTLSMPFVVIPLYLYICALETTSVKRRYFYLVLFSVLVFLGYSLKGSVCILLACAVVFFFLKAPFQQALASTVTVVSAFLICLLSFQAFVSSLNFTTPEELNERQYPLTHWVMMGLKGNGGYNPEDSNYTDHSGTYEEKKAANIKEIKRRLEEYGPDGLFKHLTKKAEWTWSDGTFFIDRHIANKPIRPNILHQFILKDGAYHSFFVFISNAYLLMMLGMICISILSSIIKPRMDYTVLLKGIIFCVFLFFLVWETRSRYLMNFTPVLLMITANGIISAAQFKFKTFGKKGTRR